VSKSQKGLRRLMGEVSIYMVLGLVIVQDCHNVGHSTSDLSDVIDTSGNN